MEKRNCKWCGKILARDRKTYCSHACRNRDCAHPHNEQPSIQMVCIYCGKEFVAIRSTRKYCSGKCNSMAKYRRLHPAQRRAGQTHWRDTVRPRAYEEQDGKCWLCGELLEKDFDVHHLLNDKDGYSTNVAAFHPGCHTRMHKVTIYVDGSSYWLEGEALDLVRKKGLVFKEITND